MDIETESAHTHTHTHRERERESLRERGSNSSKGTIKLTRANGIGAHFHTQGQVE